MSVPTIFLENLKTDSLIDQTAKNEARFETDFGAEVLRGDFTLIKKMSAEWANLCEEGASSEPFFRPEWFTAFVKNFEDEILLLTVRRGGKLRAVLPLVRKIGFLHGVPTRKLQGVFNLQSQRFDLVHGADESEREAIVNSLWKQIKNLKSWDVFETRLVKKGGWLADLLRLAETENYQTGFWQMDAAPFVSLPTKDDKNREILIADYFKNLSKNRRKLISKNRRHLEEIGKVETCLTRDYSPELMEKYFALEAGGWKARAGTAVTCDEKSLRLHDDFARAAAEKNALFVHELKLDGATIAMYLSIMFDRKTIGWKMSYDEKYAKYSPGNLLFIEVLNECLRQNSPELDQLSPATYNKTLWANGVYEHDALYIFQRNPAGWLLHKWKFSIIGRLREFKKNSAANKTN